MFLAMALCASAMAGCRGRLTATMGDGGPERHEPAALLGATAPAVPPAAAAPPAAASDSGVVEPTVAPGDSAARPGAPISSRELFVERRRALVAEAIVGAGITDTATIRALSTVAREAFVPDALADHAYDDSPLPIGYGQTISQPYIVALMTQALALSPGDKVLEIGAGSGYQAAVLAEIVGRVRTIEIIGALADRSRATLEALGYEDVEVRHADGYYGWPEEAPFDAIIVTAAPDHVPPPLRDQLADGGRLVIPVGPVGAFQELWLIERHGDRFTTRGLGGVSFVPFTRERR